MQLVSWRVPLGESGIVDFITMSVIAEDWAGKDIRIHCLRLIGNSCADTGSWLRYALGGTER